MIAHNMEMVTEITERGSALRERVIEEYRAGASLWSLRNKFAQVLTHSQVREILEGVLRPRGETRSDPTEEEIAAEMERFKSQWSAETASKRWVGRYLSSHETLGEAFSRVLNEIDRSYR